MPTRRVEGWLAAGALACAAFVITAVAAEVVGGAWANSPSPGWARRVVPLAWPQPARVAWWVAVGAAAAGYRLALHRLGIARRPVVTVVSVAPFLVFAAGVALGASWATWH